MIVDEWYHNPNIIFSYYYRENSTFGAKYIIDSWHFLNSDDETDDLYELICYHFVLNISCRKLNRCVRSRKIKLLELEHSFLIIIPLIQYGQF